MYNKQNAPSFLSEYKLHQDLIPKLKNLSKDISNIILHGPEGCDKKTIAQLLINEYFKVNVVSKKTYIKLKINTNVIEFNILSSIYHFEIFLTKYINNRHINRLLLYLTHNSEINNKFKLIVINYIEFMNYDNYKLIKNLIEKKNIKFILLSNTLCNIDKSFLAFFLLLRIPKCSISEINDYLKLIYNNKNDYTNIIKKSNRNLNEICLILDNLNICGYIDPYDKYSDEIMKLLLKFKLTNINKIRELIYNLTSKNICIKSLFLKLFKKLMTYKKNNKIKINKIKIINLYSKYDVRISNSFKNIIQYETLLINIYNVIHNS